jgi:site-specific recombinase XerD
MDDRAMDATIHQFIATQEIERRIAEATGERTARSLKSRRRWFRKSERDVAADRGRRAASPRATPTSS